MRTKRRIKLGVHCVEGSEISIINDKNSMYKDIVKRIGFRGAFRLWRQFTSKTTCETTYETGQTLTSANG